MQQIPYVLESGEAGLRLVKFLRSEKPHTASHVGNFAGPLFRVCGQIVQYRSGRGGGLWAGFIKSAPFFPPFNQVHKTGQPLWGQQIS